MDSTIPGAINLPPCKRATSREKSATLWKRAKDQLDSESEPSNIEEFPESYMEDSEDLSDPNYVITDGEEANCTRAILPIKPTKIVVDHAASGDADRILDPQYEPLFET
ncbi:Hypothetical predicted protein [Pelobates cultripes]|uniref:Uncharacterized protein n=1 Tax=Pelobates cultripes TaxID=61616 RepID=A0AAD1W649_PELCU|nr:Hypothetical predicted protein [Pelobates cultripes]